MLTPAQTSRSIFVATLLCAMLGSLRNQRTPSSSDLVADSDSISVTESGQWAASICVVPDASGTILIGGMCPPGTTPSATPNPRARTALGLARCWWTTSGVDLETLDGVGPALAARVLRFRDAGGRPDLETLDAIPGVGPVLANRIASQVDVACGFALP